MENGLNLYSSVQLSMQKTATCGCDHLKMRQSGQALTRPCPKVLNASHAPPSVPHELPDGKKYVTPQSGKIDAYFMGSK